MKSNWKKELEKLVLPLELCMELPVDRLQDTLFVWYYPDNEGCHWELLPREEAGPEPKVPAPLREELLSEVLGLPPAVAFWLKQQEKSVITINLKIGDSEYTNVLYTLREVSSVLEDWLNANTDGGLIKDTEAVKRVIDSWLKELDHEN